MAGCNWGFQQLAVVLGGCGIKGLGECTRRTKGQQLHVARLQRWNHLSAGSRKALA